MITCNLTLVDWFSKKKTNKVITPADPARAANIHSKLNPNASIILEWVDASGRNQKINLRPYNMEADMRLVEDEDYPLMTLDQFTKKWYGKLSKSKIREIEQEVSLEYSEEEEQ